MTLIVRLPGYGCLLEGAPAGRARVVRAEAGQFVMYRRAQSLAVLAALLGKASKRQDCACRPAGRASRVPALEQAALLNVRIVEVAQHALQALERAQNLLEILCLIERWGDVDEIAQLLGCDPHLVELGRRRGAVDATAAADDAAVQAPGPSATPPRRGARVRWAARSRSLTGPAGTPASRRGAAGTDRCPARPPACDARPAAPYGGS